MGWRNSRREFFEELSRLASSFEELTDWFDKTADAAMLEPSADPPPELPPPPQLPAQRAPEKPRDIMGGA